jgi:hypothetical protein
MGRVLNRARKRQPAIPEDLLAHHLREDTSPGIDGGLRVGLWRNGISLGLDRSWEEHGEWSNALSHAREGSSLHPRVNHWFLMAAGWNRRIVQKDADEHATG